MTDLDDALRRQDPDRWVSSRFVADPDRRGRLTALYTLDGEWARVVASAANALAGAIRLAWWAEALERTAAGGPAEHPALAALGAATAAQLQTELQAAMEARQIQLEGGEGAAEADRGVMAAAIRLLSADADLSGVPTLAAAWTAFRRGEADDLTAAAEASAALPVEAFPAVAHLTLARAHRRPLSALETRARVLWAVLRGRV